MSGTRRPNNVEDGQCSYSIKLMKNSFPLCFIGTHNPLWGKQFGNKMLRRVTLRLNFKQAEGNRGLMDFGKIRAMSVKIGKYRKCFECLSETRL